MAELYAIVGDMARARLMLEAHAPYLQLRFKESPLEPHRAEIAGWSGGYPRTRLIVNDELDFALSAGAWGLHLGQEDLRRYSLSTLRAAPLNLGISTHTKEELERAREYSPAMLGFGPIFATASKSLSHSPRGVARLREVVSKTPLPIVAIGGIDGANMDEVAATGAAMVAMIGYLRNFTTPEQLRSLVSRLRAIPES